MVLVGLTLAALATPASAAGDRALDHEIVSDPIGGGVTFPTAQVDSFVAKLESVEKQVYGAKATSLLNAAEAWHYPSSSNDFVLITLIGFDGKGISNDDISLQATSLATEAAGSFCSHAADTSPFIDQPSPKVPHSHYVICNEVNGTNVEAITTSRHGVLELVTTKIQTIDAAQLEAIAVHQYEHLTGLGAAPSTHKSTWTTRKTLGVGAALLALLIALAVLLMVRRNRRLAQTEHQPPHPGWYPDPRRPKRQRYWTGADWGPSDRR